MAGELRHEMDYHWIREKVWTRSLRWRHMSHLDHGYVRVHGGFGIVG
jgi:hypothetical protein